LQNVQNTISKWEETETNGEEESSVALIHMEEAQGLELVRGFSCIQTGWYMLSRGVNAPKLGGQKRENIQIEVESFIAVPFMNF
jgi:hypothetical protein